MNKVLDFFIKRNKTSIETLKVDMHCHLLPKLDDGVETFEQAVEILKRMEDDGYEKIIITPHVMDEYFKNDNEKILNRLKELQIIANKLNINIKLEAAAEHYLDETFLKRLNQKDDLLTFGKNYLLFETSYINEPVFLKEAIFKINSIGLTPVLAHPERYVYMQFNPKLLDEIVDMGTLLQVNINSLSGYYSKPSQKFAENLINRKIVSFLGSDCHNIKHVQELQKTYETKYFKKALNLNLLNNSLL